MAGGLPNPGSSRDPEDAGSSKRRKEHDSNWSRDEILALVEGKREEYIDKMEVTNAHNLMTTDMTKWGRIAEKVNVAMGGEIIQKTSLQAQVAIHTIRVQENCQLPLYHKYKFRRVF